MQPTEQLAALIERKHRVLGQLREMGGRQMDLVQRRDTASLLTLLAAKQGMIGVLQGVERELTPFYAEAPDERRWATADARARCAAQAAECNAILREIVQLEKESTEQMASHRNRIAEQLQQIHAAMDVRNAYEAQRR